MLAVAVIGGLAAFKTYGLGAANRPITAVPQHGLRSGIQPQYLPAAIAAPGAVQDGSVQTAIAAQIGQRAVPRLADGRVFMDDASKERYTKMYQQQLYAGKSAGVLAISYGPKPALPRIDELSFERVRGANV